MNTLLLQPYDILFFRDGRPMTGSLSGHGASWPLPNVVNAALHAALHRASIDGVHKHVPGRSSSKRDYEGNNRNDHGRIFGSLVSAGPFPVKVSQGKSHWYLPRPLDANQRHSTKSTFAPLRELPCSCSLPNLLDYAVANTQLPSKEKPAPWWSNAAWESYLAGVDLPNDNAHFVSDSEISDLEHSFGIGIDAQLGTQDKEKFYSAAYLRLRPDWKLGLFAEAPDKDFLDPKTQSNDLVQHLFPQNGEVTTIIAGGQQRTCSVARISQNTVPLPLGRTQGFTEQHGKYLVKWVLLTPAIYPCIEPSKVENQIIEPHPGGWLPNWVAAHDQTVDGETVKAGEVLLLDGPGKKKAQRKKHLQPGKRIQAKLVAAMVDKPLQVTGYAIAAQDNPKREAGAKSAHLAVAAGSVYYFECENAASAQALAKTLNWHGDLTSNARIVNRRSTLMGEKGFGLGVCGTWSYHSGERPTA